MFLNLVHFEIKVIAVSYVVFEKKQEIPNTADGTFLSHCIHKTLPITIHC